MLDIKTFTRDLGYEMHRVGSVTASFKGAETVQGSPAEKVAWAFLENLGIFGLLAALWGAVVAVRARRFAHIAILVWALLIVLPVLRWRSIYPRYLLPAWPGILLLVSLGIVDAAARMKRRLRKAPASASVAVLCLAVLAPGAFRLAGLEAKWTGHDPRVGMTRWLEQNVPAGEQIVCEPVGAFPDPTRFNVRTVDLLGRSSPADYAARGVRYLASSGRDRFVVGKGQFREVLANLDAIRASSDRVWSREHYAIYRLRAVPSWQDTVRQAIEAGNKAGARSVLEQKVKGSGGSTPFAWKTLAGLREEAADTAGAIAAWREVARLDTTDVAPLIALGSFSTTTGEWDAALRYLAQALRLAPRDPLIHHNLAVVLLSRAQDRIHRGDREGARRDWEAARTDAALCTKFAAGDPSMAEILGQVMRMGKRWGF